MTQVFYSMTSLVMKSWGTSFDSSFFKTNKLTLEKIILLQGDGPSFLEYACTHFDDPSLTLEVLFLQCVK